MFHGVLFDMDGVLVDSEALIAESALRMFARDHGLEVRHEDFLPFVGAGENRYIGGVAEKYGLSIDVEAAKTATYAIYREFAMQGGHGMKILPGAVEYLAACRAAGLRTALASAADRVKVLINLEVLGIDETAFDDMVTGGDVVRKKPFPDIYMEAARRIGLDPKDCLVVEDAVNGILAGLASGARCLGITTSFSAEVLMKTGALWCAPDLARAPSPGSLG
jgi:HAD superfamily hydrolase (TIGR01509 family)